MVEEIHDDGLQARVQALRAMLTEAQVENLTGFVAIIMTQDVKLRPPPAADLLDMVAKRGRKPIVQHVDPFKPRESPEPEVEDMEHAWPAAERWMSDNLDSLLQRIAKSESLSMQYTDRAILFSRLKDDIDERFKTQLENGVANGL